MRIKFVQRIIDKIRKKKINNISISNNGINNIIEVPEIVNGFLQVIIYGDGNTVTIGDIGFFEGTLCIGTPDCNTNNSKIFIGDKTTSNGISIRILEDNSEVNIGENCMFSSGIYIACSDTHTITDMNGNITNVGSFVNIGKNVWVGMNSFIGKNTTISDNSVIGMCSVVTSKKVFPPNCVIAGNPAKVVKENINWNRLRPQQYIRQNSITKNTP